MSLIRTTEEAMTCTGKAAAAARRRLRPSILLRVTKHKNDEIVDRKVVETNLSFYSGVYSGAEGFLLSLNPSGLGSLNIITYQCSDDSCILVFSDQRRTN